MQSHQSRKYIDATMEGSIHEELLNIGQVEEFEDSFAKDQLCDLSTLIDDSRTNRFKERDFHMNVDGPIYTHLQDDSHEAGVPVIREKSMCLGRDSQVLSMELPSSKDIHYALLRPIISHLVCED